jgi:hypothetical protein
MDGRVSYRNPIKVELSRVPHYSQVFVRFEVFTEVTMKNAVFCDIKTQFVPHRKHIKTLLQNLAGQCYVRFEVFRAILKNTVFWDATPCGSCKNRHLGGTYLDDIGNKFLRNVGSKKSHTASRPRRRHSSCMPMISTGDWKAIKCQLILEDRCILRCFHGGVN